MFSGPKQLGGALTPNLTYHPCGLQDVLRGKLSGGLVGGGAGLDQHLDKQMRSNNWTTNIAITLDFIVSAKLKDVQDNEGCRAARLSAAVAGAIGCEDFCRYDGGIYESGLSFMLGVGLLGLEKNFSIVGGKDAPKHCVAHAQLSPCTPGKCNSAPNKDVAANRLMCSHTGLT